MSRIKIDKNELSSIISQLKNTRDGLSSALSNAVSSVPKKVNLSSYPFTYTDRVKETVWDEEEAKYVDTYKNVTKYRYQNEGRRFNSAIASINPQLQNVTNGLKYLDNVINALTDIQSAVNKFEETDYSGRLAMFSFDFNWKNPSSVPAIDSLDKDTITTIALENGWIETEEDFNEEDYYNLLSYLMTIVGVEKFEDLTTTEDVISSLVDFFDDENGEDETSDDEEQNEEDNESEDDENSEETDESKEMDEEEKVETDEIELGNMDEDTFGGADDDQSVSVNEQQEAKNDNNFSPNINDKVITKNNTVSDAGERKQDKAPVAQSNSVSQNTHHSEEEKKEHSDESMSKNNSHNSVSQSYVEKNEEKFDDKHNGNDYSRDEIDASLNDKGNIDNKMDLDSSYDIPKSDVKSDVEIKDERNNNESINNSKNDSVDLPKIKDDFNKNNGSNVTDNSVTEDAGDEKVVSSAVAGALGIGSLLGGSTDSPTILPGSSDSVIGDFNYTNLPNNETISPNGSVTYPNNNVDNNSNYNNSNNYDNYNSVANKSSDSNEGVLGKGKSSSNVSTVNKENETNNAADSSVQSGALGEASYVEMLAKEEKKYKIATATSISASLLMLGFKYIGVIGWLTLLLLIAAIVLVYTTYRARHKKKKKKLEALIKIEREKSIFEREKEKNMSLEEAANAEIVEEPSGDIEETSEVEEEIALNNDVQSEEVQIQEIEQNLPKLPEQKEFQMAEEVIYGEMTQKDSENEANVESDKN